MEAGRWWFLRAVAQRAGHAGALRRHRSCTGCWRCGSSTSAARCACRRGKRRSTARPDAAGAAGRPRRGHPHRVVALRRRRPLRAHRAPLWVLAPGDGAPPDAHAGAGVAARAASACTSGCAFGPGTRARPWLFAVALLLPTLALLGFVAAGREVAALAHPRLDRSDAAGPPRPDAARGRAAADDPRGIPDRVSAALLAVLLARAASADCWSGGARCRSPTPPAAWWRSPVGFTILDASRTAGIPHASVCGGRGRCSTCRVRSRAARPAAAGERGRARACSRASARRPTSAWPASSGRARRGGRAAAGAVGRARRAVAARTSGRARAGDRRALRRPARLHAHGREQAPVRRRLPSQPLLRSRRQGDRRTPAASTTSSPATASWRSSASSRARHRAPPGAGRGPRHGRRRRRAERASWPATCRSRSASASASTPAARSSGAWARATASTSPPWATRSTSPRGSSRRPRTTAASWWSPTSVARANVDAHVPAHDVSPPQPATPVLVRVTTNSALARAAWASRRSSSDAWSPDLPTA